MMWWLRKLSLADVVTMANGVMGFLAITYILDGHRQALIIARLLLLIAIVLDGVDGKIARALGSKHEFGHHLDSISDMISFCIAPALLLYKLYYDIEYTSFTSVANAMIVLAAVLIFLTGILRLARYVRSGFELDYFSGSPTPATAFLLIVVSFYMPPWWAMSILAIAISYLMISDIPYPKLRGTGGMMMVILMFIPLSTPFMALAGILDARLVDYFLIFPIGTIGAYLILGPIYAKRNHEISRRRRLALRRRRK